jgi:hypothetical protein
MHGCLLMRSDEIAAPRSILDLSSPIIRVPRRVCALVFRNETSVFRRLIWLILPYLASTNETMRTFAAVFVLALITIAFEVYSDATLRSAEVPHAAPDPASVAIAHGPKGGWVREGFASSGRGQAP